MIPVWNVGSITNIHLPEIHRCNTVHSYRVKSRGVLQHSRCIGDLEFCQIHSTKYSVTGLAKCCGSGMFIPDPTVPVN
jgi:hypothetical protein